jgi:RHS repeat-associated protein
VTLVYDEAMKFLVEKPLADGGKFVYQHDGLGRLVSAERLDSSDEQLSLVEFGYTADGRLAWRDDDSIRRWYVYDGSQVALEVDEDGTAAPTAVATHVWAGGQLLRSTMREATADVDRWVAQDRLRSVMLVTKDDGSEEHAFYDPYGRLIRDVSTWDPDGFVVPYGFAGARWDAGAGLYLMGARWYDPDMGRFVEQDPITEAGGLNLYAYVGSAPTMWVDPAGLAPNGPGGLGSWDGSRGAGATVGTQVSVNGVNTNDVLTGGQTVSTNFSGRPAA